MQHKSLTKTGQPVQEDIFVNGVEIYYPVGSHHFAIFYLTDAAVEGGLLEVGAVPGIGVNPNDTFRIFDSRPYWDVRTHRY